VKPRDLVRHPTAHGRQLLREGGWHSVYKNSVTGKVASVPRHVEMDRFLVVKNCHELGVPEP
jgi:mRNA interferase HicA